MKAKKRSAKECIKVGEKRPSKKARLIEDNGGTSGNAPGAITEPLPTKTKPKKPKANLKTRQEHSQLEPPLFTEKELEDQSKQNFKVQRAAGISPPLTSHKNPEDGSTSSDDISDAPSSPNPPGEPISSSQQLSSRDALFCSGGNMQAQMQEMPCEASIQC